MKKKKRIEKAKKSGMPVNGKALSKKAVRKKRIRTARSITGWIGFAITLIVMVVCLVSFIDPWVNIGEVTGTVAGFNQTRTGGFLTSLVVKLDTGVTVVVKGGADKAVKNGDRVVVLEKATWLLGKKGYLFLRVIPNNKPETSDKMQTNSTKINKEFNIWRAA